MPSVVAYRAAQNELAKAVIDGRCEQAPADTRWVLAAAYLLGWLWR